MKGTDEMINTIVTTYINVMGAEKWNSLDARQRRDMVMTIVRDMVRAIEKIEALA